MESIESIKNVMQSAAKHLACFNRLLTAGEMLRCALHDVADNLHDVPDNKLLNSLPSTPTLPVAFIFAARFVS
jgi:hypothetical protein